MKSTLRNLDRVLGIRSPTIKIRRDKKPVVQTVTVPKREVDFLDFIEKVNGRCAVTGLYIGKAVFKFTGQDLIHQLIDDPIMSASLIGTDFTLITLLTVLFYKSTDYENLVEFSIKVMYRFAMLQWVWIISGYFF
jgi:hypothetical protein